MATILLPIDFTDTDAKNAVKLTGVDWEVSGDNVYLYKCNQYYLKLLRDYGIASDDADLADPVPFQIKEILVCYGKTLIFSDLIDDSRAPFETQEILIDKYRDKLRNAQECLAKWLTELDENAFYDLEKGTDSAAIGRFGRG